MLRSPIQQVSNKLQYRAIGIINGVFKPQSEEQFNKGIIEDSFGTQLDAVVLGKTIPLMKKHVDLSKDHYWVVYPRNKNTEKLHLQIAGIWDPKNLNNESSKDSKTNEELLNSLNLKDNFFSIRGKLIYVNTKEKEVILKICPLNELKKQKQNSFKISLKGEISLDCLNSFVSADTIRVGNSLELTNFEIVKSQSP